MKNEKSILALVVVVLLVAVVWVFIGQQPKETMSFSDGVTEINSLWEKNGVDSAYLIGSSAEFTVTDLESLNDDLIVFQSSLKDFEQTKDVKALEDFTEIHLLLVDELVLALQLKKVNDSVKVIQFSSDNLCDNKVDLSFLGKNTIQLNDKMHTVNELVYAFNETHLGYEEEANLSSFLVDETNFSKTKAENEIVLGELERVCG